MSHEDINKIIELYKKVSALQIEAYWETIIFSYQWWILVLGSIILWGVWIRLVDRRHLHIIILVGFMTSMLAILLDDFGLSLVLWIYPYMLTPLTGRLNVVDLAIIPVVYMLLYQYAKRWKTYLINLFLLCLFAGFVAEPVFEKLNLYITLKWEHWYSIPIYFMIGIFVKVSADKLDRHVRTQSNGVDRSAKK